MTLVLGVAVFALSAPGAPAGWADDTAGPALRVQQAWARATASRAGNGAAYITIVNEGRRMDRLVAVATPLARSAELHAVFGEGGVVKMRPVRTVEVHPGEPAVLRPGGVHVMLIGLSRPLRKGDTFPLRLAFEDAGTIVVEVIVLGAGSMEYQQPPHRQHIPPPTGESHMN